MNRPEAASQGQSRRFSRRAILWGSFALGLGGLAVAAAGLVLDFLTPRTLKARGIVLAGTFKNYAPGTVSYLQEGKFWLVHLTEEQGGPGFLALWEKCPHLGCAVDYEPESARSHWYGDEQRPGVFNCHCHSSIFDLTGVRIFGLAPRALDRFAISFDPGGSIRVDTMSIQKGTDGQRPARSHIQAAELARKRVEGGAKGRT
jgi:cytochrome b6-f complex iron-sulfur subunit